MSSQKGFKRFLQSLIGHPSAAETAESELPEKETIETSEHTEIKAEEPAEPSLFDEMDAGGELPPLKGSILQLWRRWANIAPAPTLSLTARLLPNQMVVDKTQLEREVLRISVQLEQEAKRRLKVMEDAAVKEITSLNAQCSVYLSRDRLIAWIFIFPPVGEEGTLMMEDIGKTLQANNVTSGIDTDAILRLVQDKPYFQFIPIAVGTPAIQGQDGTVTERVARTLPYEVMIDEEGVADYKYSNYVRQVEKGALICDITLPVPGESGMRVDGKVIEPKPVRPAKIPKGANTELTEDGLQLIASIDGHLEFSNQVFNIRPVLDIKGDVDYEVGNINFNGDVHVHGDVRENFSITATGSVSVDGLVEAASIDAGGDLVITRGVVGDNRAFLKSGGSVRVKYLENCVVYAGQTVFADCIMNSQIFSDSSICVTTGRGSIIGGALTASESIKAKMIGAQSGRRTELTLGVLPYVQNELTNIDGDLAANRHERDELDKHIAYMEHMQGMEGSSAKLAKARMRRSVLEMKDQQLLKRREKLEPMAPNIARCRLECDAVYPITSLTVQESVWVAKEVKKHCRVIFSVREGTLIETV